VFSPDLPNEFRNILFPDAALLREQFAAGGETHKTPLRHVAPHCFLQNLDGLPALLPGTGFDLLYHFSRKQFTRVGHEASAHCPIPLGRTYAT
jgi:hypothetical protein